MSWWDNLVSGVESAFGLNTPKPGVDISKFQGIQNVKFSPSQKATILKASGGGNQLASGTWNPSQYGLSQNTQPATSLNLGGGSSGGSSGGGNSIANAINQLISSAEQPIPTISSRPIQFDIPNLDAKWQEFIQKAQQDPTLIKYYKDVLDAAQGDWKTATSLIEQDYQTGVRQTLENSQAKLNEYALTSTNESNKLLDDLNKRGIALTQGPTPGSVQYAGGGEAGTEAQQLGQTQALRNEAESRSAKQTIENAGLTKESQLHTVGSNLINTQLQAERSQRQDVLSEAQQNYNIWNNQRTLDMQQKLANQQGGGSSGPRTKSQIASQYYASGNKGDVPVGYEGYGTAPS